MIRRPTGSKDRFKTKRSFYKKIAKYNISAKKILPIVTRFARLWNVIA
jgi:hypothetical protein